MPDEAAPGDNNNVRTLTIETNIKFAELKNLPQSNEIVKRIPEEDLRVKSNLASATDTFVEYSTGPTEGVYQIKAVGEGEDEHTEITFRLTPNDSTPKSFKSIIESLALFKGRGKNPLQYQFTEGEESDAKVFRAAIGESFEVELGQDDFDEVEQEDQEEDESFLMNFLTGIIEKLGTALKSVKDKIAAFFSGIKNYLFRPKNVTPPLPPPLQSVSQPVYLEQLGVTKDEFAALKQEYYQKKSPLPEISLDTIKITMDDQSYSVIYDEKSNSIKYTLATTTAVTPAQKKALLTKLCEDALASSKTDQIFNVAQGSDEGRAELQMALEEAIKKKPFVDKNVKLTIQVNGKPIPPQVIIKTIQEECDELVQKAEPGHDFVFPSEKQLAYEQEYNRLQAQKKELQAEGKNLTDISKQITECQKKHNKEVMEYVAAFTKAIEKYGKGKYFKNDGFCAEQKVNVGNINNNCGPNALLHIMLQNLDRFDLKQPHHLALVSDLQATLIPEVNTDEPIDLKKIQAQYAALTQVEQEKLLGGVVRRHIAKTLGTSNDFYTTWRTNTLASLVEDSLQGQTENFDRATNEGTFRAKSAILKVDGTINENNVEAGVFYLSKDGSYVVRDPQGKIREGKFNLVTNKSHLNAEGIVNFDQLKPDQIYFSPTPSQYALLDKQNKSQRGYSLDIDLEAISKLTDEEFDKKLKDTIFQKSILELTSMLGHTATPFFSDDYTQYLALETKGRALDAKNTPRPPEDIAEQGRLAERIFKRRFSIYADENNKIMTSEAELEAYAQMMNFKLDFYDYVKDVGYNRRIRTTNVTAAVEGGIVDKSEVLFRGAIFNKGMHWEYMRDRDLPKPQTPSSSSTPAMTPK